MTTVYEDVPHALERAETIYRRLQKVIVTGGTQECSATHLANADQLFDAARVRAAKTHGRASLDDRVAIERLVFNAEREREFLVKATHEAAKDLGWKESRPLGQSLALLTRPRALRRKQLAAKHAAMTLQFVFWPAAVIGISGLAFLVVRELGELGFLMAKFTIPVAIATGVALLTLTPRRARAIEVTLASLVFGLVVTFLSSFALLG